MKATGFIGHEIQENTELTEHETALIILFNKIKNLIFWYNQSN